jgi:predicted ArsR family transcriptional regulator
VEDQPRPNPGQASDQTKRFTVAQAAQVLGINPEAVRSRIKRGTLESVKEGGTVYVMLDTDQTRPTVDPTSDQTQERVNVLIDSLQDQVTFLRGQLTAEREAHSEARRIIAALTQRIPELEPPREPREASVTPSDASRGEEDRGDVREEPRSWWRRMFGA